MKNLAFVQMFGASQLSEFCQFEFVLPSVLTFVTVASKNTHGDSFATFKQNPAHSDKVRGPNLSLAIYSCTVQALLSARVFYVCLPCDSLSVRNYYINKKRGTKNIWNITLLLGSYNQVWCIIAVLCFLHKSHIFPNEALHK